MSAHIDSPIVIIPILKNNDPTSPIWVFNLGDMHIDSNDDSNRDSKYIYFNLALSSINVEVCILFDIFSITHVILSMLKGILPIDSIYLKIYLAKLRFPLVLHQKKFKGNLN